MTRDWAVVNTVIQVLLIVAALAAFWLARKKRLTRHCLVMRVTVGVQIVLIAALMAPSFAAYVRHWNGWTWFTTEIVVHHVLGVVVILMFIYFNLVMTGVVKMRLRLRPFMRSALVLWLVVLALGIHLFWYIWQ